MVNERRAFTKATPAESAHKSEPVTVAKRSVSAPNSTAPRRPKTPAYGGERCRTINPNAYRAPFNRIQCPHTARNRRPAGWTAIWITLPKTTVENLHKVAIMLAQEQQHSPWPKERRRYPKTKSHLVGEAINDLFLKLGFPEFCLEEQPHR